MHLGRKERHSGACCQKIRSQECYVSREFYSQNIAFLATNFGYEFFCNRPLGKMVECKSDNSTQCSQAVSHAKY